jgi:predicted branched-subunit amino acid permease
MQFSFILVMFDKKVIGICFGDHIYSFELWGCNFFLLLLLLLLFVGIIKLHILLILSILLQFCVIFFWILLWTTSFVETDWIGLPSWVPFLVG